MKNFGVRNDEVRKVSIAATSVVDCVQDHKRNGKNSDSFFYMILLTSFFQYKFYYI